MKRFKFLCLPFVLFFVSFTAAHKYYISVTQVNYVKEKKAIQIISRIFIDDLEEVLKARYDEHITLSKNNDSEITNTYIERYLKDKIKFKVNELDKNFVYIGKEYDGDIIRCYLEIENIEMITSIEIKNKVLFDLFEDQQNLMKLKINLKHKSLILTPQKDKDLLTF